MMKKYIKMTDIDNTNYSYYIMTENFSNKHIPGGIVNYSNS